MYVDQQTLRTLQQADRHLIVETLPARCPECGGPWREADTAGGLTEYCCIICGCSRYRPKRQRGQRR